jgi:acetyl/propionyl-CoA carboxylase alpha subunit
MDYEFLYDGKTYSITVESGDGNFKVTLGDRAFEVNASMMSRGILSMIIDDRSVLAYTARSDDGRIICVGGISWLLGDPGAGQDATGTGSTQTGDGLITTPMPGKIVEVHVKEGDVVEKEQPLLVLEAMKMQNEILSDVKGVVKKIHFKAGDQASFGEPLIEIVVQE